MTYLLYLFNNAMNFKEQKLSFHFPVKKLTFEKVKWLARGQIISDTLDQREVQ